MKRDQAVSDNMTATLGRKYNDLNKAVKDSCKRDKKLWIETKRQEAEHTAAKNDAKSLYKIVRDLTGSRPNTSIPIKNMGRTILLSEEEHDARWVKHFSEVLNQPIPTILLDLDYDINNVTDDADISMTDISKYEIEEGLRALVNNKASGLEFIPAELFKTGGHAMDDELTKIANIVWYTVKVPEEWNCGAIVKLRKKGNLCDCDNYRGIILLKIAKKV